MGDTSSLIDNQTYDGIKSLLGDQQDPELVQSAAHAMKSSCAYLGANQLSNIAGHLEADSQTHDLANLKSMHYQAQGMFDIIRSQLD